MKEQRVYLTPHEPRWAAAFARESTALTEVVGDLLVEIHHIGSTAIPGIRAKPIIDILGVVMEVSGLDDLGPEMEGLGYEGLGEFGIPGRRYFRKDAADGNRTHQIHAFPVGSPQIRRHVGFRDFMRAHPDWAAQYESLKIRLADQFPSDIESYAGGKDEFIREADARAGVWLAELKT